MSPQPTEDNYDLSGEAGPYHDEADLRASAKEFVDLVYAGRRPVRKPALSKN